MIADGKIFDAADEACHEYLNFDTYQQAALVTEKPAEKLYGDGPFVREALRVLVAAGMLADLLKKQLIYGRDITAEEYQGVLRRIGCDAAFAETMAHTGEMIREPLHLPARLTHATLGGLGEQGEMIEALMAPMLGLGEIDDVNLIEEAGDQMWYLALGLAALEERTGAGPKTVANANIRKLRLRAALGGVGRPEKRDLAAERAALEGTA